MAIKINIGKILSTMIWGCIGAGVLVLLVAAIRYRNNNSCKGYVINLTGSGISREEILALLTAAGAPKMQDRPVQSFDLRRLETTLEKNIWVQKSRLFFDNNNILHIEVIERTPVTRIFAEDGNSFYLDSNGVRLPLLSQLPATAREIACSPPASVGSAVSSAGTLIGWHRSRKSISPPTGHSNWSRRPAPIVFALEMATMSRQNFTGSFFLISRCLAGWGWSDINGSMSLMPVRSWPPGKEANNDAMIPCRA